MDPRPVLHELAVHYALSPAAAQQLQALAVPPHEPANLRRVLPLGIALLAAALAGLGLVFWVAANWGGLGRSHKFVLLQSLLVVFCVAAVLLPRARVPLALLAFMCIGGLFAFFGQTYQTGADAWQLFALWAALALPLCLGVRHDALWTPWAVVVMTAVTLWLHAHIGFGWHQRAGTLPFHLAAWLASLLLAAALSPLLQRQTGAGIWSLRTALSCTSVLLTASALDFLFDHPVSALPYCLALALLSAAAWAFCSPRLHDTFALSALGLSINVMLVALLVRLLFDGGSGNRIAELVLVGVAAAALLAGTVHVVLGQSGRHVQGEPA